MSLFTALIKTHGKDHGDQIFASSRKRIPHALIIQTFTGSIRPAIKLNLYIQCYFLSVYIVLANMLSFNVSQSWHLAGSLLSHHYLGHLA